MTLMWLVAIKYLNSWTALAALLAFQDVAEQFPKPHRLFPYSVVYCFWQLQCSVCIPPPMTMVHLWLALHTQTHTIHTHTHTHTQALLCISVQLLQTDAMNWYSTDKLILSVVSHQCSIRRAKTTASGGAFTRGYRGVHPTAEADQTLIQRDSGWQHQS